MPMQLACRCFSFCRVVEQIIRRRSERKSLGSVRILNTIDLVKLNARWNHHQSCKPGESSSARYGHSAADMTTVDECILVLHGGEFQLGDEIRILGDSAYYSGNIPHRFCAVGEEELVPFVRHCSTAVSR
jgi:hypothetical protein